MSLSLYFHTVRHLKPRQVYGRVLRSIWVTQPSLEPPPQRRKIIGYWADPARCEGKMTGPSRFCFLNEVRDIDGKEGWNDPGARKLWLYNLHYFDDLKAQGGGARREWHTALIRKWIDENPPVSGNGWEPFPISLRIVNWIKWALEGNALPEDAVHSLAVQARWLERTLETHLLGNHLFANAKALIFAGLFFEGAEANRWFAKGVSLLRQEVPEQVLPDGGHFERSPMYHCMILEDLLDLLNMARAYGERPGAPACLPLEEWQETAGRMLAWLAAMLHPDGEIALVNDAAFGIASSPAKLAAYAGRLGIPLAAAPRDGVTHLEQSGYIRVQQGAAVAILDVGPLGPDYLPGHGHADTLSFELSLHGARVIVDTGTSCYEEGPERMRQRGTAAHNTVVIDGVDSSEVWGNFRVARRAKPFGLRIEEREDGITVECVHDGYRRLPGRVIHRRKWWFSPGRLRVEDSLEGRFRSAEAGFLLHPEIAWASRGLVSPRGTDGSLLLSVGSTVRWSTDVGKMRAEPSTYHPEFGVSEDTVRFLASFAGPCAAFDISWD